MKRILLWIPILAVFGLWLSRFFIRDGGVGVANGLVVFLIVWWLVIFTMLPIGVRSQHESGEIAEGTEPGAPVAHNLGRKAWWTTVITACIWLVYFAITQSHILDQFIPKTGYWD